MALTDRQALHLLDRLPALLSDQQVSMLLGVLEQETKMYETNKYDELADLEQQLAALEKQLAAATSKGADDPYEQLILDEIGHSFCPRHVAQQRLIEKGIRPDTAGQVLKARASIDQFQSHVDSIAERDGCGQMEAMRRARKEHGASFQAYQEAQ